MNRTGLFIALAVALVVGLIFGIYPQLDLAVAGWFFDPHADPTTAYRLRHWLMPVRDASMWLVAVLFAPALLALIGKLLMPRVRMLIPARAAVLLVVTMALGPGLLVNVITKEHWGRARPIDVHQMGGQETFVAWWDPRGDCPDNCSFVSGDVSAGIWTLAPAALTPLPWRPVAYAGAIAFGAAIGVMRMLFGAHFLTDVVFAGVLTFLVIWLIYGLLYRWKATRITDAELEQRIERLARPGFLFPRAQSSPAPRVRDRDRLA
jgi:membrane-associated PAP2 superfamily phosphatase